MTVQIPRKQILILHIPDSRRDADQIVAGLRSNFGMHGTILRDALTSGPLDIWKLVTESDAVIIIDNPHLFTDSVQSAIVYTAINLRKAVPLSVGKPSAKFGYRFAHHIDFRFTEDSWQQLKTFIEHPIDYNPN